LSAWRFWRGVKGGRVVLLSYAEFTGREIAEAQLFMHRGDIQKAIVEVSIARQTASRFLNICYLASAAVALFTLVVGFPAEGAIDFLGLSIDKLVISPSILIIVMGITHVFAVQFYANYLVLLEAGKSLCEKLGIQESRFATPLQDMIAIYVPSRHNVVVNGKVDFFLFFLLLLVFVLAVAVVILAFLLPPIAIINGLWFVPKDCPLIEKFALGLVTTLSLVSPFIFLSYIFVKKEYQEFADLGQSQSE
jgi:hypothetical protein